MSHILKLYRSGKLFEAKKALIQRADFVASLVLEGKKAAMAGEMMGEAAELPKKPTKRDKISVDGEKPKMKRKIKFEFTEDVKKK